MIIARSPLRITLGGGGTDLPSYYRLHGGFLIAGAINKHVYVSVNRTFNTDLILRYSQLERVQSPTEIRHPLIREALLLVGIHERNIEITTMADIPAGTGLGSSGSFGTALLKALLRYRNQTISQHELAEMACHLEIDVLQEPVGKQDQYAATCGGLNCYEFLPDDRVRVSPLRISEETLKHWDEHVVFFCTGVTRSASSILRHQVDQTREGDRAMLDNLHAVKELGYRSREALEQGDLEGFAGLMHEHWERKRTRSGGISNPDIERWYALALENGALGGKLIGAGGGGFLMFYAADPLRVRDAMHREGLMELRCTFDYEGTKIL